MARDLANPEKGLLHPFFTIDMPPLMGVMSALLIAFILGIGIAVCQDDLLRKGSHEFQRIIEKLIASIIIPLLPLHICGIFANMTHAGQVAAIMSVFAKVFLCHHLPAHCHPCGSVHPCWFGSRRQSHQTAQRHASSLHDGNWDPVLSRYDSCYLGLYEKNGVAAGIADFVIPLCATIHLSGSTITLTSCTMAVMLLNGRPIEFSNMFGFILMLGVTMVAAPGVPGGAVMAALGILQSMMGFTADQQALMIALYLAQDSFGTACNVTGDGAIAILVNKIAGNKLVPLKEVSFETEAKPNMTPPLTEGKVRRKESF